MTGRQRVRCVLEKRAPDRNAFWMGDLHTDSIELYYSYFGVQDNVSLAKRLGSDIIWRHADKGAWSAPDGSMLFEELINPDRKEQYAWLADCEDISEIENVKMPSLEYFDYTGLEKLADHAHSEGIAFFSGMWSPFFHIVSDSFGMENYFIKMYECPEVVDALTEKVLGFYMDANKQLFERMADKIDVYFFGNDLGSQIDLLISPDCFRRFILPGIEKLVKQAKSYGLPVAMHSCGSIERIIPDLIKAGVDILHPIQAMATNMDAGTLSSKYKEQIGFMGGVDAQVLLPFGSPDEVRAEVKRITGLFGDRLILSPSHEKILPNIPPQNIEAIAEAVGSL